MDEILDRLLAEAATRFGAERAAELKPILESTALDLKKLKEFSLEPEDVP